MSLSLFIKNKFLSHFEIYIKMNKSFRLINKLKTKKNIYVCEMYRHPMLFMYDMFCKKIYLIFSIFQNT